MARSAGIERAHNENRNWLKIHRGNNMKGRIVIIGLMASAFAMLAQADINVGVTVSATGPAASLGIPEKNTFALMPTSIGGQKVNYIILDDATDTTTAVKNTRKHL